MYTKEQVASVTDHAVLKPEFCVAILQAHAGMCIRNRVFSMCVQPCNIAKAKELLKYSDVKVSCVLSFPHGADSTEVKVFQAADSIKNGVDEIDMVMNIGRFMERDYDYVVNDIRSVADTAHKNGILLKVIIESGFLTLEQVADACELVIRAGADFVKTSTGFGPGKATREVVEVMVRTVAKRIKIKASGGIRTWEDAVAFLDMGVDRLGIGSTEEVLNGFSTLNGN